MRANFRNPRPYSNHDDVHIRVGEYCFIFSAKRPLPPIVCERPLKFVKGHHTLLCVIIAFVVQIYWCVRAFKRLHLCAPRIGIAPHFVLKSGKYYYFPLPVISVVSIYVGSLVGVKIIIKLYGVKNEMNKIYTYSVFFYTDLPFSLNIYHTTEITQPSYHSVCAHNPGLRPRKPLTTRVVALKHC